MKQKADLTSLERLERRDNALARATLILAMLAAIVTIAAVVVMFA